ncbi:nitrile hydratase subunit beta [Lutimaribacter sp. EGI FJ00015]|uniref:Nitrile hydratase subunit beta n=1 Tax=Lutimaribacter degradans TaxID=2945989 RepID=A0ACC5ZTQ0_9RHOB|nr:nitrile hydratase subunit beta [Lutimaribacter sp. EGI FJ00013]MCM2561421.1 nitrile hydratase subunit beta [Lutimaribacter sp. EGI FJ00013]MCO0612869.1 nitrile hydratase subunit beta [Lutimaribacter sp. EGI FJ00015]MCO0635527.1 nitrile hydratase subunit beta [Lutimaribacter sp. EGI FJ00014]
MTRVHDMGGRFGDGPVAPAPEPVFKQEWHARALAVTLAAGALGQWNLDTSRHSRERLSPSDYARFSYFEKWISALADLLEEHGVVTRAELAAGQGDGASPLASRALKADQVAGALARGGPADRPVASGPRFAPGDGVRTRRPARNAFVPGGHTRLPAYAAGAVGRILHHHGGHVLPDANAHGLGEAPEHLYTVVFDAAELWGTAERAGDEVTCDLWESYLEPA